jgi:hypothetical protein
VWTLTRFGALTDTAGVRATRSPTNPSGGLIEDERRSLRGQDVALRVQVFQREVLRI